MSSMAYGCVSIVLYGRYCSERYKFVVCTLWAGVHGATSGVPLAGIRHQCASAQSFPNSSWNVCFHMMRPYSILHISVLHITTFQFLYAATR